MIIGEAGDLVDEGATSAGIIFGTLEIGGELGLEVVPFTAIQYLNEGVEQLAPPALLRPPRSPSSERYRSGSHAGGQSSNSR